MASGGKRNRHILLQFEGQPQSYTSPRKVIKSHKVPFRERRRHAEKLLSDLDQAVQARGRSWTIAVPGVSGPDGITLGVRGPLRLALKADSLEMRASGIKLLNVKKTSEGTDSAAVYVPLGKVDLFIKKLKAYRDEETPKKGLPKNKELVESISAIEYKVLETLWTDEKPFPDKRSEHRFELWLWREANGDDIWEAFRAIAGGLGIAHSKRISFPERDVVEAIGSLSSLAADSRLLNCLAEIKFASEAESFFRGQPLSDQGRWIQELRKRTIVEPGETRVCILDTGVNNGHPLLRNLFLPDSTQTYDPDWGTHDRHGHGTEMAGLAAYGDLTEAFLSEQTNRIRYSLESVKILEPILEPISGAPIPSSYITTESVNRIESTAPFCQRIFCCAVSEQPSMRVGYPSTWSASIDQLSAGEYEDEQRLFIIAAGNSPRESQKNYPHNLREPVHSPGQSWNALTIGAYTQKTTIDPDFPRGGRWTPLATSGGLSPSSCSSFDWEKAWPYKPDVVFEGGNAAKDETGHTDCIDGLNLLTTSCTPFQPLRTTGDTSAATALASRFAATLWAQYPDLWPETVRGLVVHSADWTEAMKKLVGGLDSKTKVRKLLRLAGYGVPNLDKALWSASNSLTLLVQDELRPYCEKDGESRLITKDLNLHELPWPKAVLQDLDAVEVEMRVTLSYFIEPSPGQRGWTVKHRYASHGLRFEVKLQTESLNEFKARVNKEDREDDEDEEGKSYPGDSGDWLLGQTLRTKGSICSDVWRGTAAELADRATIAVFPVTGWWKERKHLGRWDSDARYSLVVTIRTPEVDTDIYTPVLNQIQIPV